MKNAEARNAGNAHRNAAVLPVGTLPSTFHSDTLQTLDVSHVSCCAGSTAARHALRLPSCCALKRTSLVAAHAT